MQKQPTALPIVGISVGRHQLAAAVVLEGSSEATPIDPRTPALLLLAPGENGSLCLECGPEAAWRLYDQHPAVVAHAKELLGLSLDDPRVQRYASRHPATKLVQRDRRICFEMELDARDKEERKKMGFDESTKTLAAEEVIAALIADMKQRMELFLGTGISGAVITVPPHFNDAQRQAMKDAATVAGVSVKRIINEPTAVAMAYGLDKRHHHETFVLVFNMGATTTTATLLSIEDGIFEVVETRAIDLGGNDFVENMVEHCASHFQKLHAIDLRPLPRPMARLRRVCARNLELLSRSVQTTIEVDCIYNNIDLECKLSRAFFELLNNPHFERCLQEIDDMLRMTTRAPRIDHIALSGGLCNMPKIPAMLQDHFPHATLNNHINPENVEAIGAAVLGSILCGPRTPFTWWEMTPAPFWNITGAGLYHEQTSLDLTASRVDVSIVESRAEVTVTQTFRNAATSPLEATYVYPVEDGSAVCAFSADVDGRLIRAVVKEKQQAKEAYEDAISSGHGAYLLEELTGDIFQINIGNMQPDSEATITLTYASDLNLEGNSLRFSLPSFSSSKYVPRGSQSPAEASHVATVGAVTDLTVDCTLASPIVSISSPTHPTLQTQVVGCSAKATLTASLAQEFVLKIEETNPRAARLWIETSDAQEGLETGSRAAAVTFFPEFPPQQAGSNLPVEIIFLVDRSGSMSGKSMEQARNALMLFLKSLPVDNVSFNIIGFGTDHERLFPSSVAYDDDSLQKAQLHVASLDADLGGTEILRPLEEIFKVPEKRGVPRQVILLTDGEVGNTEHVIQCVKQHSKSTRVFTLGIGAGASHRLIKGVAHAGRGTYEFVASGERIEGKVMRQLRNALQPFMTEATVTWGSLNVSNVSPQTIGPLYSGQKVTLFATLEQHTPLDDTTEVRFEAKSAEGRVSCSARLAGRSSGRLLHTLAAKSIIGQLEEEAKRPQVSAARREEIVAQIATTSLKYGVASSEASFVAVEERENATEGTMLSAVPEMTSCVGGVAAPKMVKTQRTSSTHDVLLIDVTPLTLGFDVDNGGLMIPVIHRNTTIPCRKAMRYQAKVPASGQLTISVYEGERPLVQDNSRLGDLLLSLPPHLQAGAQVSLEVQFDLDANGVLYVEATEASTGTKERLVITNDKGRLSKNDIERVVKDAEAARVADQEIRRQIEALCASGSVSSGLAFCVPVSTPYDANVYQAVGALGALSAQLEAQRKQQADKLEAQYMQLVALQKANGEWELSSELGGVLRFDVKQRCPPWLAALGEPVANTVMATLAALAFLHWRVAGRREEWELIAGKARARLRLLLGESAETTADSRLEEARAEIQEAMEAATEDSEQKEETLMAQASAWIDGIKQQLADLRGLLSSLVPPSWTPSAAPQPARGGPQIEEVD